MTKTVSTLVLATALALTPVALHAGSAVERITPAEAAAQAKAGRAVIVDVRERNEIASGMAEGARWYPTSSIQSDPDAFAKFVSGLPADQTVVFYCAVGVRAGRAAEIASKEPGRKAANLGGFKDWQAAGLPVAMPAKSLAPGS
jgi:rhodanese-related sulfurtransferase